MILKQFIQKKTTFVFTCCILLALSNDVLSATVINTCTDLQNMRLDIHDEYLITNDIDCRGFSFSPVGMFEDPFTGILDGAGHTIRNLNINKNANYIGLFGFTKNANINHLILENVYVKGRSSVGSLIGQAHETQVNDVASSGTIEGVSKSEAPSNSMGGLIGYLRDSTIIKSSFSGTVTVISNNVIYDSVGGLIGNASNSSIHKSHSRGSVFGTNGIGGLIGSAGNSSVITNSYSTASVDGASNYSKTAHVGGLLGIVSQDNIVKKPYPKAHLISQCYAIGDVGTKSIPSTVGGLVGGIHGSSSCPSDFKDCFPRIENNYATGRVYGYKANLGGFIGAAYSPIYLVNNYSIGKVTAYDPKGQGSMGGLVGYSTVSHSIYDVNNYWDIQTSNQTYSKLGYGKQTIQMHQKSNFVDWNFDTIWSINENQGYPFLIESQNASLRADQH